MTGITGALIASSGSQTFSITAAHDSGTGDTGYSNITPFMGTLNSNNLQGYTLRTALDLTGGFKLQIGGFSAAPSGGASSLISVTINGVTYTGSSLGGTGSYNYSSTIATWIWGSPYGPSGMVAGNTYTGIIVAQGW